jgi:hypothetical protein
MGSLLFGGIAAGSKRVRPVVHKSVLVQAALGKAHAAAIPVHVRRNGRVVTVERKLPYFSAGMLQSVYGSIEPGEKEPVHHHRWPSVFVIDSFVKLRDFDGEGREIPLPIPDKFELPLTVKIPPQPLHSVRCEDTVAFHGTRVEFKRGYSGEG